MPLLHERLTASVAQWNWCSLMIDRAVLRELAAMLFERAEHPNQVSDDRDSILPPDESEQISARPVRSWYEALLQRRSAF